MVEPATLNETIRCENGYGWFRVAMCAEKYRLANGKQHASAGTLKVLQKTKCNGCPHGEERNAGADLRLVPLAKPEPSIAPAPGRPPEPEQDGCRYPGCTKPPIQRPPGTPGRRRVYCEDHRERHRAASAEDRPCERCGRPFYSPHAGAKFCTRRECAALGERLAREATPDVPPLSEAEKPEATVMPRGVNSTPPEPAPHWTPTTGASVWAPLTDATISPPQALPPDHANVPMRAIQHVEPPTPPVEKGEPMPQSWPCGDAPACRAGTCKCPHFGASSSLARTPPPPLNVVEAIETLQRAVWSSAAPDILPVLAALETALPALLPRGDPPPYRAHVRGVAIDCRTLEDLDALVKRYGAPA